MLTIWNMMISSIQKPNIRASAFASSTTYLFKKQETITASQQQEQMCCQDSDVSWLLRRALE
jgi:hypothetical protein